MSRTIPNTNRSFIIESLLENKRVDGRSLHQFRDLQVNFGQTYGTCYVQLGHTVVLASTEATVDEPRITRPAEGLFKVQVNIGAGGKERWLRQLERSQPKEAVLTTRLLEKIINRINVLDLESLCLVTGKYVWCISTKLVLLNFDGNLIEAASIATIASLMHFRRPEATVTPDGDIIIHSLEEHNPLPLTLFHYPICVTFQFMDNTLLEKILSEYQEINPDAHRNRVRKAMQLMICDPTEEEEDFLHNVLVVCANTYREIVAIQSLGRLSIASFSKQLLNNCTAKAFERVKFVTDYLKSQLSEHNHKLSDPNDKTRRYCFLDAMKLGDLCVVKDYKRSLIFEGGNRFTLPDIGDGGVSKWTYPEEEEEEDSDDEEQMEEERQPDFEAVLQEFQPKNKQVNYADKLASSIRPVASKTPLVHQNQIRPPTEYKEKKNKWIKYEVKQNQNLTKTEKRKQRKKAHQKMDQIGQKKIPKIDSDDEEEEVKVLDSEYNK